MKEEEGEGGIGKSKKGNGAFGAVLSKGAAFSMAVSFGTVKGIQMHSVEAKSGKDFCGAYRLPFIDLCITLLPSVHSPVRLFQDMVTNSVEQARSARIPEAVHLGGHAHELLSPFMTSVYLSPMLRNQLRWIGASLMWQSHIPHSRNSDFENQTYLNYLLYVLRDESAIRDPCS